MIPELSNHKMKKNTSEIVNAMAALAQESRLAVFKVVIKAGGKGICPCNISEQLNIPRNTLSFHLKILEGASLIQGKKEGKFILYSANTKTMRGVIEYLLEDCCADEVIASRACLSKQTK